MERATWKHIHCAVDVALGDLLCGKDDFLIVDAASIFFMNDGNLVRVFLAELLDCNHGEPCLLLLPMILLIIELGNNGVGDDNLANAFVSEKLIDDSWTVEYGAGV